MICIVAILSILTLRGKPTSLRQTKCVLTSSPCGTRSLHSSSSPSQAHTARFKNRRTLPIVFRAPSGCLPESVFTLTPGTVCHLGSWASPAARMPHPGNPIPKSSPTRRRPARREYGRSANPSLPTAPSRVRSPMAAAAPPRQSEMHYILSAPRLVLPMRLASARLVWPGCEPGTGRAGPGFLQGAGVERGVGRVSQSLGRPPCHTGP